MRSSRENRVDSGVNKQEVTDEAENRVRSFSSLTEGMRMKHRKLGS